MQLKPHTSEFLLVTIIGSLLLLCYHWIFSAFFPAANGNIGHDYAYFLPSLLDGYNWQLNNGALGPQWFSPAFCGGLPAFPNPQNIYYSLPQWLSQIVDPLTASYFTMLTFAGLGFAGFYLLLRLSFKTAIATALLGATLFMFNGFFSHRLLIGHITYHAFMLTPMVAFLLLDAGGSAIKFFSLRRLLTVSITAALLSYMIYSGMIHLILPVILTLVFIGSLHGIIHASSRQFWQNFVIAGIVSIILALPKLAPAILYINNFERISYKLPGADGVWGLITLLFESLFFQPSSDTVQEVLVNLQGPLARHEFEYGITFIPLLIILISAALLIKTIPKLKQCIKSQITTYLQLGLMVLILVLALAINYYTPEWNAILKQIPIIKHSSLLVRWFCIFIPVTILIAALMFDKLMIIKRLTPYITGIAIITVVVINFNIDRGYYANQPYNPSNIIDAYIKTEKNQQPKIINQISVFQDRQGRLVTPIHRNDSLVQGASQLLCYEPLFGYGLELLPLRPLRPGLVSQLKDGQFNVKNPACYIFGDENNCKPGDHFLLDQKDAARAFVSYESFTFKLPTWLEAINVLSVTLLIGSIIFWLAYPIIVYINNRKSKQAD